ncbi:sulfatase family protein [Flavihumibacter sp. UBA7668]|uniref:sulfatase family protein n=1 Tax=Flavihumibacter sp. UBA7668 TaxID=1946542 RepID=UPI0025BA9F6A|nr:sulfatase [Flavihumibacter sp. UBA7668]
MRNTVALLGGLFFLFCGNQVLHAQQAVAHRPNIILIIGDDISVDDLSCYNQQALPTPNLDKLAAEGLKFNRFFVTASSCSPSRASILTGRYPHNTGAAELHSPVPSHLAYFPELLKNSGYYTALAGKWHEGPNTARAYDTMLLKHNGAGGEAQWEQLVRATPANKPFFLWLAAHDAHRPWDNESDSPFTSEDVRVFPHLVDMPGTRQDIASYYNEIYRLDQYVGKLLKVLKEKGVLENTLVLFVTDNGRPFPGSKTLLYDRGVQSPLLLYWPDGIAKPGAVSDALISSIDLAPTFCELAGVSASHQFQGRSFAGLLNKPDQRFRNYVFLEQNWHDFEAHARGVRTERYLYIKNNRPQFNQEGPLDVKAGAAVTDLRIARNRNELSALQQSIYTSPRAAEEFYDTQSDSLQFGNRIDDPSFRREIRRLQKVLKRWIRQTGDDCPDQLTADWYNPQSLERLSAHQKRGVMPGAVKKATYNNRKGPF